MRMTAHLNGMHYCSSLFNHYFTAYKKININQYKIITYKIVNKINNLTTNLDAYYNAEFKK